MTQSCSVKKLLQLSIAAVVTAGSCFSQAASNEELLQIIERLENRIEQLEGQDAVQSEPDNTLLREALLDDPRTIQSGPAPAKPFELIPTEASANPDIASGIWKLHLNIVPEESKSDRQSLRWSDVESNYLILDQYGVERTLKVKMTMTGQGHRTKIGRSLLLRTRYDYDFGLNIDHTIYLDSEVIHSSQQRLSSDALQVDDKGRISSSIQRSLRQPFQKTLPGVDVVAQFGCTPSSEYQSNLNTDALRSLNQQACLQLSF